jgi:RND family efflux transporter MFP subunit
MTTRFVPLLAVALLTAACSGGDGGTAQAAPAGGKGAGGAAGPGGRGGAAVVLAATDVGVIERGTIEDAAAISGDLRPVETVEVRARLEGDLDGVYVREGDRVREGQLLAAFEASEQVSDRRSAQADQAAAESELSTARWTAEQTEELLRAGAVPERDARAARSLVVAAEARLAAAQARVRSTSSFVTDTRVLAPTRGIVAARAVEDGEHVARGASMFTVVRNDVLELAASVPARRASDIRAGQTVRFTADGRRFDGRVARVNPTIDPASRSLTVYVEVPNGDGALRGNSFATGRVVGRAVPNALLVPTAALRQGTDSNATFVYRIAGERIERAPVRLGIVDDVEGVAEVAEGLNPGDRVVVGNVGTLGDGMRVTVVGEGGGPGATAAAPVGAGGPATSRR